MAGYLEALVSGIVVRGVGSGLFSILMAGPAKKVMRAQLKKIYVLNELGDMVGEYVLEADCPIDYNDFLKVLPADGIGDREALFVGEYVFTAFQSGKSVFVLLSRGHLSPEDIDWTALLLSATEAQMAQRASQGPQRAEAKATDDAARLLSEREARIDAREKSLAKLEAQMQADQANLRGRAEELERQKARVASIADYAAQTQNSIDRGVSKALQALEVSEQIASSAKTEATNVDVKGIEAARGQWEEERKGLIGARDELEARLREASDKVRALETQMQDSLGNLERERQSNAARFADEEKMRAAIEARVQDLGQRFTQMAKERLVASHRPAESPSPTGSPPAAQKELEVAKAEAAKERKFLQRRAIEMLDREERARDRETKVEEREKSLGRREQELLARESAAAKAKMPAPASGSMAGAAPDMDEARKDIERRVKIIQQKALELLDREEKLRKRAAELEALEARLSRKVSAD
jgi:hypothetical protein